MNKQFHDKIEILNSKSYSRGKKSNINNNVTTDIGSIPTIRFIFKPIALIIISSIVSEVFFGKWFIGFMVGLGVYFGVRWGIHLANSRPCRSVDFEFVFTSPILFIIIFLLNDFSSITFQFLQSITGFLFGLNTSVEITFFIKRNQLQ